MNCMYFLWPSVPFQKKILQRERTVKRIPTGSVKNYQVRCVVCENADQRNITIDETQGRWYG